MKVKMSIPNPVPVASSVKIPFSVIQSRAARQPQPDVYLSAYETAGKVSGGFLHIDAATYIALNKQFLPTQLPLSAVKNLASAPEKAKAPLPFEEATWKELHTYKLTGDRKKDARWLMNFGNRIRSGSCQCRKNWQLHLFINPVRWDDFFAWTVEMHNIVNALLKKPAVTLVEARKQWEQLAIAG